MCSKVEIEFMTGALRFFIPGSEAGYDYLPSIVATVSYTALSFSFHWYTGYSCQCRSGKYCIQTILNSIENYEKQQDND